MKTNFWKSAAALALGVAAMVACQPEDSPEVIVPVFPEEVVEQNVEAGASVELTFEANQDWEVAIPASEQNRYWLDDAGIPASKVSGKAGSQTVTVVFSEDEYYDENVLCEVTLSMGGQSQVIAKLTRLAINRSLEVYTAEKSDWSFKSTYNKTKAEALELTTFRDDVTYTLPVQVVANYDWSLALPEWCEGAIKDAESLSGKAGQVVEVLLTGKLSEAVKAGATGFAKFIDAADNAKSEDLALTLPAFENRIEFTEPATMDFAADGTASHPTLAYVLGMKGFVVKALEYDGTWHATSFADWVTATVDTESATQDILQLVAFTLSVTENTGSDRVADLFVFPASMANVKAEDICNPNKCDEFNDEYAPYHVGRVTQAGKPQPFMVPVYSSDMLEAEGVFFADLEPKGSDNIMQWDIEGAQSYHKITYTKEWAYESANFRINKPFATCKFYEDTQYPEGFFTKEVTPDWIEFWSNPDKTLGRFNMLKTPSSAIHIAAVFFDEAGNKVAAVLVEYNEAGGGSSAAAPELSLTDGQAEISTMPETSELYQILSSNLGVTAVFEVNAVGTAMFTLNQPFSMASVFDMTLNPTSVVMTECFDQYGLAVGSEADNAEVIIILKNDSWVNVAAIHYTYSKGGNTLP